MTTPASTQEMQKLQLGTATPGGGFPVYGAAFIAAVMEADPGLAIEAINTKGSTENVPMLEAGRLDIALVQGDAARYPAQIAPFMGVPHAQADIASSLPALMTPGDTTLLLGIAPRVPDGYELKHLAMLAQMVCEQPVEEVPGPAIIELGEAHRQDVLALTALVYPHYFRPRTMELGRYIGVTEGPRLDAMLGERMGFPGFREISAVCTHPDHVGKGLARHLLATATAQLFAEGTTPFLHVSPQNTRAVRLYEQNGFVQRTAIAFWSSIPPVSLSDRNMSVPV